MINIKNGEEREEILNNLRGKIFREILRQNFSIRNNRRYSYYKAIPIDELGISIIIVPNFNNDFYCCITKLITKETTETQIIDMVCPLGTPNEILNRIDELLQGKTIVDFSNVFEVVHSNFNNPGYTCETNFLVKNELVKLPTPIDIRKHKDRELVTLGVNDDGVCCLVDKNGDIVSTNEEVVFSGFSKFYKPKKLSKRKQ